MASFGECANFWLFGSPEKVMFLFGFRAIDQGQCFAQSLCLSPAPKGCALAPALLNGAASQTRLDPEDQI
jgi:hypothetical protein